MVGMLLANVLSWLSFFVLVSGVIVCALYLGRARWAGWFMSGFALQVAGQGLGWVLALLAGEHEMSGGIRAAFHLVQILRVLGTAVLVGVVLRMLSESSRTPNSARPSA